MRLIRPRFNYDSFHFPPPLPQPSHLPLPQTKKEEGKSSSICLGILLEGILLSLFLPLSLSLSLSLLRTHIHSCTNTEKGKENRSATSVLPFSSPVMNRELCKRQSNLRTGKLDGQSGGTLLFA